MSLSSAGARGAGRQGDPLCKGAILGKVKDVHPLPLFSLTGPVWYTGAGRTPRAPPPSPPLLSDSFRPIDGRMGPLPQGCLNLGHTHTHTYTNKHRLGQKRNGSVCKCKIRPDCYCAGSQVCLTSLPSRRITELMISYQPGEIINAHRNWQLK